MKLITNSILRDLNSAIICTDDLLELVHPNSIVGVYYNNIEEKICTIHSYKYEPIESIKTATYHNSPSHIFSQFYLSSTTPNYEDKYQEHSFKWPDEKSGYTFNIEDSWLIMWLNGSNTEQYDDCVLKFEEIPTDWSVNNVSDLKTISVNRVTELMLSSVMTKQTKEDSIVIVKYLLHIGIVGEIFDTLEEVVYRLRTKYDHTARSIIFSFLRKELLNEIQCRKTTNRPHIKDISFSYNMSITQTEEFVKYVH